MGIVESIVKAKVFIYVAVVVIIAIALISFAYNPLSDPAISAEIDNSELTAGETATFVVKVHNFKEMVSSNVTLLISTADPSLSISDTSPESVTIGSGEYRFFTFTINTSASTVKGGYYIDMEVPALGEKTRALLKVI